MAFKNVENGAFAHYEQILHFRQCFQESFSTVKLIKKVNLLSNGLMPSIQLLVPSFIDLVCGMSRQGINPRIPAPEGNSIKTISLSCWGSWEIKEKSCFLITSFPEIIA
jgi:hypothetical protein